MIKSNSDNIYSWIETTGNKSPLVATCKQVEPTGDKSPSVGTCLQVEPIKLSNQKFIIKHYSKSCKSFQTEVKILSMLSHLHIISVINVIQTGIIFPQEDSNLSDYLESSSDIPINIKNNYISQVASGLNHIHKNNILHLDLKLDNIMITNNLIKIIDFGSAEFMIDNVVYTKEIKCTATHRPPEGFVESLNRNLNKIFVFDLGFDIWSFGIVMYEILFGVPIYLQGIMPEYTVDLNYEYLMYQCVMSDEFHNTIAQVLNPDYMQCLNINSNKRLYMNILGID